MAIDIRVLLNIILLELVLVGCDERKNAFVHSIEHGAKTDMYFKGYSSFSGSRIL